MKKRITSALAILAATFAFGTFKASAADIYDVQACDQYGVSAASLPLYTPDKPMIAGEKAYFKLRFLPRIEEVRGTDVYSTNKWSFAYTGLGSAAAVIQPQIGIFVSGELRYATYVGTLYPAAGKVPGSGEEYYFSDMIFEYVTKPGDFALPIVLAADNGGTAVPATDKQSKLGSYYLNPLLSYWTLKFPMYDGSIVEAEWKVMSGAPARLDSVTKVGDVSLSRAGYCVRTIDFSSSWETNGVVWRLVHEDSTITANLAPQLVAKSAADTAISLYVWSLNEDAVEVSGSGVTEVEMANPTNLAVKTKYHVGKVTLAAGQLTQDFVIKGKSQTANDGWANLVLSAYDHFNVSDMTMDLVEDFVTVPVRCIEKLPPSVIVEPDRGTAIAPYNYKECAARLTVKLSQPVARQFKVKITPKFSDDNTPGFINSTNWVEYVRFSTAESVVSAIPDATEPVVTLGGNKESETIYVFCLKGDSRTTGINQIEFVPVAVDGPGSVPEIESWAKGGMNISAQVPVITTPAEGEVFEAVQFDDTPMTIKVEGSYADADPTKGYEIWVKYSPSVKFVRLGGDDVTYYPGEGNILYKVGTADELPVLTYTATSTYDAPLKSQIYVKATVSNKTSSPDAMYRNFLAVVSPAKSSMITAYNTKGEESQDYSEGDRVKFRIELSESTDSDMYAFLKPSDNITDLSQFSGTTPFIIGMTNNAGKCLGLRIPRGKTSCEGTITVLDGFNPDDGGLNFSVEAVFLDQQEYTNTNKKAKFVKGYDSNIYDITVNNVEPSIDRIELNGIESETSGYKYPNKYPKGQTQTLVAKVTDKSYDLSNGFQCKWTVTCKGAVTTNATLTGKPADTPFKYNFPQAGDYVIRLQVKDKDMEDWLSDDYKVEVEVLANPTVMLEASELYYENDTKATVGVGLSYFEADVPLTGMVEVAYYKSEQANPGKFVLETTNVVFSSDVLQQIRVSEMDGTTASGTSGGFLLTASITDTRINPKTNERWCDYYLPATVRVNVENVAPNGGDESKTFTPAPNTNVWEVAGGAATSHPLKFFVRSDVDEDFTYSGEKWKTPGIKVTITGGGGEEYNQDGFVKGVKYFTEAGSGTYIPNFGSSQGDHEVTITVEDKDEGSMSRTWKFTVTPSKMLTTTATKPSGGTSSSPLSQKYVGASGIGAGHVFALDKTFVSATDFRLTWNCSKDAKASLYGWGYKIGAIEGGSDQGGNVAIRDSHDQTVDVNGNAKAGATVTNPYKYKDAEKDSFLYCWIQMVTDEEGQETSGYLGALAPERAANDGAGVAEVTLPAEASEDKTYPATAVEAIFSKEYLPTDNMGDINQDGVPDLYVSTYKFGVIDETTGAIVEGGNDLKSLKSFNADKDINDGDSPDFLPGYAFSEFGSLIPGLPEKWTDLGTPFTAYMEIRGYGDGLNDAPALAGITGVKPDRIYAENVEGEWKWTENCTISELEFAAWLEYAAATFEDANAWTNAALWAQWSPECPTNPMLDDTDEDGFSDGYEYYFWYRAHVGDPDVFAATKKHVRLTGRRFDPRNPGVGQLITSEEIEKAFNPRVASGSADAAKLIDTDNDGLPDYLEFLIGTNPLDFDSDGDGLPDGWEIMIAGLDPLLKSSSADALLDSERNYDGDAMAITSYKLEQTQLPVSPTADQAKLTTFAVLDPNGDTDGVQWYAVRPELLSSSVESNDTGAVWHSEETRRVPELVSVTNKESVWSFKLADDERSYISYDKPRVTAEGLLAVTLAKGGIAETGDMIGAFVATKPEMVVSNWTEMVEEVEVAKASTNYICTSCYPVRLAAGTKIAEIAAGKIDCVVTTIAADIEEKNAYALWIYGRGSADTLKGEVAESAAEYGCLALGRQLAVKKGALVVAAPSEDRDVAFLHYLVYQEFGFDPRTAWNAKTPLANRWGKTIDGEAVEGVYSGYAGAAARTRNYTTYDEFLVYSFFLNNGTDMNGITWVIDNEAPEWASAWGAFTTNPQGPNEPGLINADHYFGRASVSGQVPENGADSDNDGVPDGWELYVMAGPKNEDGSYVYAPAYGAFKPATASKDMTKSFFSPFVDSAKSTDTSNQIYLGGASNDDLLNEFKEFEGTDTMNYYADYSTTIVHEGEWKWFNKFFPTDPWAKDTDKDGIDDKAEGGTFAYGTPADSGSLWSIPGGGLNPCSVDTDQDGLPDPWEAQFKGKTVYSGDMADYAPDAAGNQGNPLQGLVDGMDGTVKDARSYPIEYEAAEDGEEAVVEYVKADGFRQVVNRDYDHDGLENWQEYLTGTMRCWRYDDPISPWTFVAKELYFDYDEKTETWSWNPKYKELGVSGRDEFWYQTLVNKASPIYNPFLVTDMSSGAMYFSRVTNVWDPVYRDAAAGTTYYWFKDRIDSDTLTDLWGPMLLSVAGADTLAAPSKYICCSPVKADSDGDGMDDYYELFHGMNPLLGKSGVRMDEDGPCDLVYDAWTAIGGKSFEAYGDEGSMNFWQANPPKMPEGNKYDFRVFPWLNGAADADPDGDILPNQEESLLPKLSKVAFHTDPTPLWMTDSSYSNSLTRMYFRMPARFDSVNTSGDDFTWEGTTYKFSAFGCWVPQQGMTPAHFGTFAPDYWNLAAGDADNWMFSFEENEGYDTDHDGISDYEEKEGRFRSATDPQDADSPSRRQAMYFQGAEKPSALQTMPFVSEKYPTKRGYPDDMAFIQFTVECWANPESLDDSVLVERAVWTGESSPADVEYMRKNFQIGIKAGYWFAKFDPIGTADDTREVLVQSKIPVEGGKWTHVAATYDGTRMALYVNGKLTRVKDSGLAPSWGASVVALTEDQKYWFDHERALKAIIIGASAKTQAQGATSGSALDVTNAKGWGRYTGFYKGWIDEVRIWDGARTIDQIASDMNVRYTAEMAAKNRSDFYEQWKTGMRRYAKDGTGKDANVMAELRYHWSFDSIFGADNAKALARVPHDFGGARATLSRPDGYEIAWWKKVLFGDEKSAGYEGGVYSDTSWVNWIPNTVTHLPRFDGTTLDSVYWCKDYQGAEMGAYAYANVAEPVSFWTQLLLNGVKTKLEYQTTGSRHFEFNANSKNEGSQFSKLYRFAGRNLNQTGDDLIPLGGAYAKYCDNAVGLWDKQGASSNWEISGSDTDGDGLPNWWERYADENYRGDLDSSVKIGWNTIIEYNGLKIAAGEAYLRDLSRGAYEDEFGETIIPDISDPSSFKYRQVADADANGVPDWWADMYGIRGESGLADHDNDGLPNYVEYLLSEAFDFGIVFDPTDACSVDPFIPDYFYRPEGSQLYVGEIFTDHDLVDDAWEDLCENSYASRLDYDAFADSDKDGWSNRSENRYAKQTMPIVAGEQWHYTAVDGLVADYPIPTLSLTLNYNGSSTEAVSKAPIVVMVTSDATMSGDFDATFNIGSATSEDGANARGSSGDDASGSAYTRTIGKWSNRHAIGTLTPGYIDQNSLKLEYCYDPSAEVYSWIVSARSLFDTNNVTTLTKRGTRAEYDADRRKYSAANVEFISRDSDYRYWESLVIQREGDSNKAIWYDTDLGKVFGTIDLKSGAFDLDLGIYAGQYAYNTTNANDFASLEDQTFRISYSVNESVGIPRKLYLGEATTGHVREGKNKILAFADLDANGAYTPGEPFGCAVGVDVSWKGTEVEIELTETSVICPRMVIGATGDNDRTVVWGTESGNWTNITVGALSGGTKTRVRVIRTMYNDTLVSGFPGLNCGITAEMANRVILDKYVDLNTWPVITEADFLGETNFDVDWETLRRDILSHDGVNGARLNDLLRLHYRVVLGEGTINLSEVNNLYPVCFARVFDSKDNRVKPTAVSPGTMGAVVHTAAPTFKWTMDKANTYTAFRIVVSSGKEDIYDSGYQRAPESATAEYEWTPSQLRVGDLTLAGKVFENKKEYTWKVSMYNSKFTSDLFSEPSTFMVNVQTDGFDCGSARVAVKYFGPTDTYAKSTDAQKSSVIRVKAYASPDFTGVPVASGYVASPDDAETGVAVAGAELVENCRLVGIPAGTYYLQAFIDSNNNGICDPWESSGYFCKRDGSTPDSLNPVSLTFGAATGKSDLAVIYIEDADMDNDGLPDAWEVVTSKSHSLEEKGVELIVPTKGGEFVVNPALSGALKVREDSTVAAAGLAGKVNALFSNAGVMALSMGAPVEKYDTFAAAIQATLSPELVEGGVKITTLSIVDGNVLIALDVETTSGTATPMAKLFDADGKLDVTCTVLWTPTLAVKPTAIYAEDVTVGAGSVELDISAALQKAQEKAGVSGDSGFFSVSVEKK